MRPPFSAAPCSILSWSTWPNVNPGEDLSLAVCTSDLPYRREVSWDGSYNDVSIVDLKTSQAKKIKERRRRTPSMSPGGKYLLYFDEDEADWFTHRLSDGARVNLTEKLKINFWREDHDTPNLPGSYVPGAGRRMMDPCCSTTSTTSGRSDPWQRRADCDRRGGRKDGIVFRYCSLDPEQRAIPTDKPMLLSTNADATDSSGFYRVNLTGTAAPQRIVMIDKAFGQVTKARDSERVVFTLGRFDEFPDQWVSDTTFEDMKRSQTRTRRPSL